MSSAEYTALPTDDSASNPYPPQQTRAPPANPKASQSSLTLQRILIVAVIAIGVVLFWRFDYGLTSKTATPSANQKPIGEFTNPNMFGGRPRSGKLNVGYFANWGIYGRKYPPQLIPAEHLSHLLYAFANIRSNGEVHLSDDWADKDIHYPGDSWNDPGHNLYGNFKAIYLLKKKYRHLKLMLSIGGWTYSPNFHPVVVSAAYRAEFVRSSLKILEDYGLDGIDVDYEYPSSDEQARGYTELLRLLREALDAHAAKKGGGCRFELSIAAPCGPSNYHQLHAREMDKYLDMWNLMAYDYSGSWDKIANHQASVYHGPINTDTAVRWYKSQGIAPHKLIIGLPLYGRSFTATDGPGTPFSGVGPGSWEAGMYDYRALPLPNSTLHRDAKALASWSYDQNKREMISFDDAVVAKWKAEWIIKEGLGGAMFWELSGDKSGFGDEKGREGMDPGEYRKYVGGKSLVEVAKDAFGKVDQSQNWLEYTESRFENMRKGMPGQ